MILCSLLGLLVVIVFDECAHVFGHFRLELIGPAAHPRTLLLFLICMQRSAINSSIALPIRRGIAEILDPWRARRPGPRRHSDSHRRPPSKGLRRPLSDRPLAPWVTLTFLSAVAWMVGLTADW